MNADEITDILKHILAKFRVRFLDVFASDKRPPLNSIQSLVPCWYDSNIDPTGKGGSHWGTFSHSWPNPFEFFDSKVRQPCEISVSFPKSHHIFHNPYQILAFGTQVLGISVSSFSISELTTIHCIQYVTNSQHFHLFVQLQLFLHLFINYSNE